MAFAATGLVKNRVRRFRRWVYTTTDTRATVGGAGYFNAGFTRFAEGDEVTVVASDGSVVLVVTSLDGASPVTTTTI